MIHPHACRKASFYLISELSPERDAARDEQVPARLVLQAGDLLHRVSLHDPFLAVNGTRMEERLRKYQRLRVTVTRLDTLVREYMRIIIRDDPDGRWASVVAEASAVAAGDEPFRAALIEQSARGNGVIADAMLDMAERTGVEFRLPRAQMIKVGSALMRGLLLQRLLDPRGVPREFIEDVYVAFIEAMARPRSGAPRLKGRTEGGRKNHDADLSTPRSGGLATGRRGA
jgi:hypothetical protein